MLHNKKFSALEPSLVGSKESLHIKIRVVIAHLLLGTRVIIFSDIFECFLWKDV
jgi:hypothetical protein